MEHAADRYPARLEVGFPETLDRFSTLLRIPFITLIAILSWFADLFTSKYPQPLFSYVVGVGRYRLRVSAYGFLLIADRYPTFRLSA